MSYLKQDLREWVNLYPPPGSDYILPIFKDGLNICYHITSVVDVMFLFYNLDWERASFRVFDLAFLYNSSYTTSADEIIDTDDIQSKVWSTIPRS